MFIAKAQMKSTLLKVIFRLRLIVKSLNILILAWRMQSFMTWLILN